MNDAIQEACERAETDLRVLLDRGTRPLDATNSAWIAFLGYCMEALGGTAEDVPEVFFRLEAVGA